MKKLAAYLLTFLGLVALVGLLGYIKVSQFTLMGAAAKVQMPPDIVTSVEAKADRWQPTINTVGTLVTYQGVTVTSEASGIVEKICFEAGSKVNTGDLLVKFDTSVLEAQLESAQARAELAKLTANRTRELFASNSAAKADLDTAEAQLKQAVADLAYIQAQINQKQVRAPFAGRLGIRNINVGQYIDKGAALVTLQSLDPIYVNFTLPQQQMGQVSNGMKINIVIDAFPGQTFEGAITAVNPDVDSSTRNVSVQATLQNGAEKLRPGMFVNVAVVLPNIEDVVTIPVTAVLNAPYGDSVFVIEEKANESGEKELVLSQIFVRLGKMRGDYVSIVSGLKPGQRVVASGVFKMRNNARVIIDNKLAPEFSKAPTPGNS